MPSRCNRFYIYLKERLVDILGYACHLVCSSSLPSAGSHLRSICFPRRTFIKFRRYVFQFCNRTILKLNRSLPDGSKYLQKYFNVIYWIPVLEVPDFYQLECYPVLSHCIQGHYRVSAQKYWAKTALTSIHLH